MNVFFERGREGGKWRGRAEKGRIEEEERREGKKRQKKNKQKNKQATEKLRKNRPWESE